MNFNVKNVDFEQHRQKEHFPDKKTLICLTKKKNKQKKIVQKVVEKHERNSFNT